jgi:hypothetical protein
LDPVLPFTPILAEAGSFPIGLQIPAWVPAAVATGYYVAKYIYSIH